MDEVISDIANDSRQAPRALARDLCTLAGWYNLLCDPQKRDVALNLAVQLLAEAES